MLKWFLNIVNSGLTLDQKCFNKSGESLIRHVSNNIRIPDFFNVFIPSESCRFDLGMERRRAKWNGDSNQSRAPKYAARIPNFPRNALYSKSAMMWPLDQNGHLEYQKINIPRTFLENPRMSGKSTLPWKTQNYKVSLESCLWKRKSNWKSCD